MTTKNVWDPGAKQIKYVSDNSEISTAEAWYSLILEDRLLEQSKFGALNDRLKTRFQDMKNEDWVRVVISLKYPEGIRHPSKFGHSPEYLEDYSKQLLTLFPEVLALKVRMGIT